MGRNSLLRDCKVTSEVHIFSGTATPGGDEKTVVTKFKFTLPAQLAASHSDDDESGEADEDGDPNVRRRNHTKDHTLAIKHHVHTSLDLVGLQVWRGAFLLADYLLHSRSDEAVDPITENDRIVELGAGTGLTTVVAAMVAGHVTSTDIDLGNILELIETNCQLNAKYMTGQVSVMELDFNKLYWTEDLQSRLDEADLIIAADVIYHNDLTDAFLRTLKKLMTTGKAKKALVALEKRYVFTIADMDTVAPCFEYFYENLQLVLSDYRIEKVDTDPVPQYFCYERTKDLVLFRISRRG